MSKIEEMDLIPRKGEIKLYVCLHEVDTMTPVEVINLCQGLGFSPELRCRTWDDEGETQYGLYALLHSEQRDYESQLEAEYVTDKAFEILWNALEPNAHLKVHFSYCLKHGRAIETAATATNAA